MDKIRRLSTILFYEVFKDPFLNIMPVEAVGVLVDVGLQVEH